MNTPLAVTSSVFLKPLICGLPNRAAPPALYLGSHASFELSLHRFRQRTKSRHHFFTVP